MDNFDIFDMYNIKYKFSDDGIKYYNRRIVALNKKMKNFEKSWLLRVDI